MNIIFLTTGELLDLNENSCYPDLLRQFKNNNHSVYAVCQRERRFRLPTELKEEYGIKVLRVKTGNITKNEPIKKGISIMLIGFLYKRSIKKYFRAIKFDMVIYSTPPITIASTVSYIKNKDNAFAYLMLKDIFPQNSIDIGILKMTGWKGIVVRYFRAKEKKLYLLSDVIGCMSMANVEYLIRNNPYLSDKYIEVCPNTVNPSTIIYTDKKILKNKFGLPPNKIIFVYGGNFGKPQDVDYIIKVLKSNEKSTDRFFVMCGAGTDFNKIKEYAKDNTLKHIMVIENLDRIEYRSLLEACDVGLIFLDHRFTIPNFPSRLLDYMNYSMPVLAATDTNTDIGNIITKAGFGWCCESNNVDAYNSILKEITSNTVIVGQKGKLGRIFLEENYDTKIAYLNIMNAYNRVNGI